MGDGWITIARIGQTSSLPRLLVRLMRRADLLPPHPVPESDNELRPLASMRDLLEAGRKYRNCLAHRLADIAAGKIAIAEFRGECLVEFRPMTPSKGLASARGPRRAKLSCPASPVRGSGSKVRSDWHPAYLRSWRRGRLE